MEVLIQEKLKAYNSKPFLLRFFSEDRKVDEVYQSWILTKTDIHSILQYPARYRELPAILNLYALTSAILAAILGNAGLARMAEKIRIIAEEVRNKLL